MTSPGHNRHLFQWRSQSNRKTSTDKMHVKNDDIDQWRKRVEMASEFAVSQVFSKKKPHSGTKSQVVPLQSTDQLRDHDDAYSEAEALLGDWLNSKLQLELEMEDDDDDDLMCSSKRSPAALTTSQPTALNYDNFNDLYSHLAEEEEHSAVNSFLHDLMEQEVLDSGMMEELALDVGQMRKKFRDPIITMEARHQQVRENRAQREAERQRQQRAREAQRGAREEAKRRQREEEMRKKQEARRQEEMVQQEMVRLRRQMEERRGQEQLIRQRERERVEEQRAARSLQSAPTISTKQQQQQDTQRLLKEQKIQTVVHMRNLKATYGQCQLAVESDRRRLLRRFLIEWQLWCRMEREQRELLAQQQETRRKMAALIKVASTGTLKAAETLVLQPVLAPPEAPNQLEIAEKEDHHRSGTLTPDTSAEHQDKAPVGSVAEPTQPWQVTRRHVALTAAELHDARQRGEGSSFTSLKRTMSPGSRFEHRHAAQQQIITQQRRLLKEQQEQIAQLKQEQNMTSLEQELKEIAPTSQLLPGGGSRPKSSSVHTEQRALKGTEEPDSRSVPLRKAVTRQTCPHPIITAMELRARQRTERRKEIEELKRKKEDEKLAELKAADEQRKREEEEDKCKAAEKRREEKRLERERQEEKQRQLKRQQELLKLARQHYHRTLLQRGLAPWKRLIQLRQANMQLMDWGMIQEERAERFYRTHTLRRFLVALLDHVTQERLVEWDRRELAQEHNNRRVLQRCFLAWRQLPSLLRQERVKKERREKLGRKTFELDQANIPAGNHLSDEQVVHVCQREESQAEEEERPSLFTVGDVVVPQHQAGQSCQNHNAKKEVEGSKVQQDGKDDKRRDDRQFYFAGSSPQPGHTNPLYAMGYILHGPQLEKEAQIQQ
ncbi:hypothetical protein INR49_014475, partial [Caranx melampygus]